MTVLTLLLLVGVLEGVHASSPHSKVMRTQMDVDYTGRVRQAPGANSMHVGGRHEIRDEEEDESLAETADEDEGGDDWQRKPTPTALNAMTLGVKEHGNDVISQVREEVIRQAASIPFKTMNVKGSLLHDAEDKIQQALAHQLQAATSEHGLMHDVVQAAAQVNDAFKNLKARHKETPEQIAEHVTGMKVATNAGEALSAATKVGEGLVAAATIGNHVTNLVEEAQKLATDVGGEHVTNFIKDAEKVAAGIQQHLEKA